MNVTNEVGTLKEVGLFGPPGIETYLAQFYPPEISHFFESFDICAGHQEFLGFQSLLSELGITILDLKGAYALKLESPTLSSEELVDKLVKKIEDSPHTTESPNKSTLEYLLQLDANSYGEEAAVALNEALSLNPELPLGNIFFARDQANVLFDTCFLSNMKNEIRKPEVAIIKSALLEMGCTNFYQVSEGTFEGGDAMIIGGDVYIGCGMRTDPKAVAEIATELYKKGIDTYQLSVPDQGSWKGNMEIMHFDTFGMHVDDSIVYGCKSVFYQCTATSMQTKKTESLMDHFITKGITVEDIPQEEQKNYAANMLVVAPKTVIVASDYNPKTTAKLQNNGVQVYSAKLEHLTQAVGATHCMALQTVKV
tara:strand:+ start:1439 stop:2539 length:1101 start_codon:yes stop_codon:yes gene_type:complete